MKKTLLLTAFVLAVFLLFSCGGSPTETGAQETETEPETAPVTGPTETEESQAPETDAPEIEYLTDVDLRAKAVEYMHRMANIEWTLADDTTLDFSSISPKLVYTPGKYLGFIYNTEPSCVEDFEDLIAAGPYSNPGARAGGTPGNTCSTSILAAWQTVSPNVNYSYTIDMMPGVRKNGVIPVGNVPWDKYDGSSSVKGNTQTSVLGAMERSDAFEAYALARPGDAFMRQLENGGHALMVTGETTVVRKSDGTINPDRSYVILTDQNSVINTKREFPSSWGYDVKRSFASVYSDGYLPVTLPELVENKTEKPYFKLDDGCNLSALQYGRISCKVVSNYNINDVFITVSKDGTDVLSASIHPHKKNASISYAVRNLGIESLEGGSYRFTVTASTPLASETVLETDFTK